LGKFCGTVILDFTGYSRGKVKISAANNIIRRGDLLSICFIVINSKV